MTFFIPDLAQTWHNRSLIFRRNIFMFGWDVTAWQTNGRRKKPPSLNPYQVPSYCLMSTAIGARDTESRGEIQLLSVVFTGFSVDQAPLRSGAAGESTSSWTTSDRRNSLFNLENLGLALKHHEFPSSRIMKSHLMSAAIGVRDTGSRGEKQTLSAAQALKSQRFHQGSCLWHCYHHWFWYWILSVSMNVKNRVTWLVSWQSCRTRLVHDLNINKFFFEILQFRFLTKEAQERDLCATWSNNIEPGKPSTPVPGQPS